ncbi:hypothetical protein AVEN_25506-1, partial [Araneus ventricosus]
MLAHARVNLTPTPPVKSEKPRFTSFGLLILFFYLPYEGTGSNR